MRRPSLRICQLTHVETNFKFLVPLFRALAQDGHDVVAASNLDRDGLVLRHYLGDEYEVHRTKVSRKITVRACTVEVVRLARYLARERFDVVHLHGNLAAVQGRLAARLARVPVVINHVHGFYFHEGMRPVPRLMLIALERLLGRYLTDYTITVNEEDRQFALRNGFAADPSKIIGTPGVGIDTQQFSPRGRAEGLTVRREWSIPDDDLVVTFVGRLVSEKGLLDLATAFSGLLVDRPAWLWLVGDVNSSERDQTALRELDDLQRNDQEAARRTIRLGLRHDIPQILAATDILVLPSYREGMPVSVLEAMACAVPVITTDVRGCREAVAEGDAGILVPARDPDSLTEALRKLAADPEERQRLGSAGRALVEARNTTAQSVAPLLALYRRIDASRRDASARAFSQIRQGGRRVIKKALPTVVRSALTSSPKWRIVVQQVADPLTSTPDSTQAVFSDEELDDLGLAFLADPFAVHRDGTWHLFFEQVRKGSDRGEIGLATSTDLQTWTYRGTVLAEPFHLSYPHVVEAGGETFMIPEACASGSVRIYRTNAFPFEWHLVDVTLKGQQFKDSTLVEHDGNLFLFTETSARHSQDELRLFVGADVRGPWAEHPASPLVVGNADAARPAGRVLKVGGQLVRLTQCCSQRYGAGVRAHVIEQLSPRDYRESRLYQQVLQPSGSGWNARASHHIDVHRTPSGWYRFVDGHS
jgi:glycosyltransferase involved in cell wall biosynthesis